MECRISIIKSIDVESVYSPKKFLPFPAGTRAAPKGMVGVKVAGE
jgi:hypothetical protein